MDNYIITLWGCGMNPVVEVNFCVPTMLKRSEQLDKG